MTRMSDGIAFQKKAQMQELLRVVTAIEKKLEHDVAIAEISLAAFRASSTQVVKIFREEYEKMGKPRKPRRSRY